MPDAAESVAVKVELAALSSEAVTSSIEIVGASSSSVMIKVAVASLIVALEALESVKVAVSLFSSVESLRIGTVKVPVVSPAEMVKVPLVAV